VRQAAGMAAGDLIDVEFADGRLGATVNGASEPESPKLDQKTGKTPRQKTSGRGGQGSLF
jgi:exodeoxyribonuclease VII large subunit